MKNKETPSDGIRSKAEFILNDKSRNALEDENVFSNLDKDEIIKELQLHEIELEIQNQELGRIRSDLEISRQKYFHLYEYAPIGYCTIDSHGNVIEINNTALLLFNTTRKHILLTPFIDYIDTAWRDTVYLQNKRATSTGITQKCHVQIVTGTDRLLWVELTSNSALYQEKVQGMLNITMSDITDNKSMEISIQESEARYRTIVECSPEPIIIKSDGYVLYVNNSAVELLGVDSPSELIGRKYVDMVLPEFQQRVLLQDSTCLSKKSSSGMIHSVLTRKDGALVDVDGVNTYIQYDGVDAVHSSLRDITERLRMHKYMLSKNIELENAKKSAEAANKAKSAFISGMSHDLRTPLNAILGFAQLIAEGSQTLNESQKKSIFHIQKAGWYLLDLINDILDLSAIESGTVSLSFSSIDMLETINECVNMVDQQASIHGIDIMLMPPTEATYIIGDSMRVKQIITNLITNGIKYNRPGGKVIIDWEMVTHDSVRINIRDTGKGLSESQMAELFQPFSRLGDNSIHEQGTGIGLVVCKRLVEAMGGEIGVHSNIGVGSIFWFTLKRSLVV